MSNMKEILSFRLEHDEKNGLKKYFTWDFSMIWVLFKYSFIKRKKIKFTVIKAINREEYYISFYIKKDK